MCGIFGYVALQSGFQLSDGQLLAMQTSLYHRGPDDRGLYSKPGVALGNTRLAIIDLESGHQPFVSDDEQIVVVQNGEIYNYVELRQTLSHKGQHCRTQSDTEVILRMYELYGIDFVSQLNGMFAIAIWDNTIKKLFLLRDQVGMKPLYVYQDDQKIIFASEIKAILACGVAKVLNHQALDQYLTFNYVPPPLTMFNNIRHIMPATWESWQQRQHHCQRWWSLSNIECFSNINEREWIANFHEILDEAVRIHMRSDVAFGAFLSGGLDSSTIVGKMKQFSKRPIYTYHIGFNEPAFDESEYALAAAARFHTRHTSKKAGLELLSLWPFFIYHSEQPHGDVSFMPTYKVAELARADVKMVLTGDGADELFAGYDKYKLFFNQENRNLDNESFLNSYMSAIVLFDEKKKSLLYQQLNITNTTQLVRNCLALVPQFDRINQALYLDYSFLLPGNNLVKPDKMGMATSLEARMPFLDPRMIEFAFHTPGDLKLRQGETKYLYKRAVRELIGDNLAFRQKKMFTVPVGEWFKNQCCAVLQEILFSSQAKSRGLFNQDYVKFLFEQHRANKANYTRELRALVSLEMWFLLFMDDQSLESLSEQYAVTVEYMD